MAFTERERKLGIGVGIALAVMGVFYFGYQPYVGHRAQIRADREAVDFDQERADNLFALQKRQEKVWTAMIAGGLKSDPSEADSQVLHALQDWAGQSKIANLSFNTGGKTQEGKFHIFTFQFAGTGTTAAVANFLWRLETATIPVRVNEIQVTPKKEGVDDLQLQLSVSTLSMVPEPEPSGRGDRSRALTSAADERGGRP